MRDARPQPAVLSSAVAYSPKQACRHLGISAQQLSSWHRQQLISRSATYSPADLALMRALLRMKAAQLTGKRLREALQWLRDRLREIDDPLAQARVVKRGRRVLVRVPGQELELFSGQIRLRFDDGESATPATVSPQASDRQRKHEAEVWFQRGLELEQSGAPIDETIAAYRKAAELDERSAGALVNLGTIYFNARQWRESEKFYRLALQADPSYALAHFNLANLYDERGDRQRALHHYEEALRIRPGYADAHYNLALLFQTAGQAMKALKHWKTYLKLDPGSSWAVIARREMKKLQDAALVEGSKAPSTAGPRERGLTAV